MRQFLARLLGFQSKRFQGLSPEYRAGVFGVGWTTLGTIAGLCIRLVSNILLTRQLVPNDYGIFSVALNLLMIVEFLSDFGLRPALVQHPKGDSPEYIGTAWMILLLRGAMLSAIVFGLAWAVPPMYPKFDWETLHAVILVLSIKPFLHSFCNPMMMLLHRQMRFGRWTLLELSQTVFGTVMSLSWAYAYQSVWAIVAGTLMGEIAFIAMSYIVCARPPRPRWNRQAAKDLSHVGNQVFLNTLLMALWLYLPQLIAPTYIPAEYWGLFFIAWNLMEVIERLAGKAGDVYYSLLTKVKDPAEQVRFHEKVCRKVTLYMMPALAVGILLAPSTIRLLYEPKYHGADILFAILVARVMLRILGQLQFQLLLARAQIYLATYCYIIALAVQLLGLIPLAKGYGTIGVAYSVLISTFALTFAQNAIFVARGEMSYRSLVYTLAGIAIGLPVCLYLELG
jgi:O-antigen/teichoic acid export membrane protein